MVVLQRMAAEGGSCGMRMDMGSGCMWCHTQAVLRIMWWVVAAVTVHLHISSAGRDAVLQKLCGHCSFTAVCQSRAHHGITCTMRWAQAHCNTGSQHYTLQPHLHKYVRRQNVWGPCHMLMMNSICRLA